MIPRWPALLTATALVSGSLLMVAAGNAHAAVIAHPGGLMQRPPGAVAAENGQQNQVQSTNWSGYVVSRSGGSFQSVSASWTQPSATCGGGGDQFAAFWVGLGGYNGSSVEQTGTESDCHAGTTDYYGWYEMYPATTVYFSNPVQPGDGMTASVTFSGTQTYTLMLTDKTQGWKQTETESPSAVADSSAEVITEAPSSNSGVLPLTDFGTVNYSAATVNGSPMDTLNPTTIVMVSSGGDQLDSTAPMDTAGDFSNTWQAAT
jgi:Peptidase A4 family